MNEANFSVIEDTKEYSIVWQIYEKDSDIVKKYSLPGAISLPHFVTGKDLERLEKEEEILLSEFHLIVGLLLRYNAIPPMTVTHKIKPYFGLILDDLIGNFVVEGELE